MHLPQAEVLLADAKKYFQPEREKSIFDVGARGHYENPTTDLLAFFLNPEEEHGLGDCFLRALLDCVGGKDQPARLIQEPQREVSAKDGKRMDLLLHGEDWGLLLENKIFSGQYNPFSEYEDYFDALCQERNWQHPMRVILSPSGESQPKWTGLRYETFIAAVHNQLEQRDAQFFGKWLILAKDFLLHLKNLTTEHEMDSNAVGFVFKHLPEIRELKNLHDQAIIALDKKILENLEKSIPEYSPYPWKTTWSGDPILRYGCNNFGDDCWSNVTLCLHTKANCLEFLLRVYLVNVDGVMKKKGNAMFAVSACAQKSWKEKDTLVFEWKYEEFCEEILIDSVVEKMKILMRFERWRLQQSAENRLIAD